MASTPVCFFSAHLVEQPKTRVVSAGTGLPAKQRHDGVVRAFLSDFGDIGIVDAALIAQLAVLIENKHVRRGDDAVRGRGGLRLAVVQIREGKILVFGPLLHIGERIAQIGVAHFVEPHGVGIVRRDGHERDALRAKIFVELNEPVFVRLRRRAVIAREYDGEHAGFCEIGERVGFIVDARQFEIGCRLADLQSFALRRCSVSERDLRSGGG